MNLDPPQRRILLESAVPNNTSKHEQIYSSQDLNPAMDFYRSDKNKEAILQGNMIFG